MAFDSGRPGSTLRSGWTSIVSRAYDVYTTVGRAFPIEESEFASLGHMAGNRALTRLGKDMKSLIKSVLGKNVVSPLLDQATARKHLSALEQKVNVREEESSVARRGDANDALAIAKQELAEEMEFFKIEQQRAMIEARKAQFAAELERLKAGYGAGDIMNDYGDALEEVGFGAIFDNPFAVLEGQGYSKSASAYRAIYVQGEGQEAGWFGPSLGAGSEKKALALAIAAQLPNVVSLETAYGDYGDIVTEAVQTNAGKLSGFKKFIPNGAFVAAVRVSGLSPGATAALVFDADVNGADWDDTDTSTDLDEADIGGTTIVDLHADDSGAITIDVCLNHGTLGLLVRAGGATVQWDVYASEADARTARGGKNVFGRDIPTKSRQLKTAVPKFNHKKRML